MVRWMYHLLGLLTPLVTILGIYLGGWWMGSTIYLALGLYPILDYISGTSSEVPSFNSRRPFDVIVHIHGFLVPVVILVLFWKILTSPVDSFFILGVISVGFSSGASGIITAHELGHRKPKSFSWWLARLDLLCVNYLHFTVEHNHTHHKHWAREVDPTSSKFGQSIYGHFIRTVPKQIKGAYNTKSGNTIRQLLLEITLIAVIFLYSIPAGLAFISQALVAVFLLEFVNYLQHHGLARDQRQRAGPEHAWESRHRWSRWTLLELPLHPSHHLKASTHYERLETHDDSPQLPFGYYVMFWISLIPPLFEKVMRKSHERFLSQ